MKTQNEVIMLQQVSNIEKLTGGKARFISTVNSYGKRTRQIVIEYDDERQ